MVLLPVGIYQYRVNTFYNSSISVDINDLEDDSQEVADKYLNYYSVNEDLSDLEVGTFDYEMASKQYVHTFINNLNNISPSYNFDTLIKPGIETILDPHPIQILSQSGDTNSKYKFHHIWIVKLNKKSKSNSAYLEGTLNMFSPHLFFIKKKDLIDQVFDSNFYNYHTFFGENYLLSDNLPEAKNENEFNWRQVLMDSSYYVETQKVKFYDKKVISKLTDHRLNTTDLKYVFVTDLIDQGNNYKRYFIGVNLRAQKLLLDPSDYYALKRLEYFLFKRFTIQSLEQITPEFVYTHAAELQKLGSLINLIELDYGNKFVDYNVLTLIMWLLVIYLVTSIVAIILLTVRLLNFRLLVISLLSLCILSFILFIPLIGFRVNILNAVPAICLSILYSYFIYSIIRILYVNGTTLFMRISALSGLIVIPLIAVFYFCIYINNKKYFFLHVHTSDVFLTGFIILVLFLIGHIPLMARIIHRMFYLPKR
jgi:hypothetical protein